MDLFKLLKERPLREFIVGLFIVTALLLLFLDPLKVSIILGNSMEPTFSHGDIVIYSGWAQPSEGDIVIFYNEDGYRVSHRIIKEINPGVYVTKGDNNNIRDKTLVDVDKNYRGEVIAHIELSKYIDESYLWRFHPQYQGKTK